MYKFSILVASLFLSASAFIIPMEHGVMQRIARVGREVDVASVDACNGAFGYCNSFG